MSEQLKKSEITIHKRKSLKLQLYFKLHLKVAQTFH